MATRYVGAQRLILVSGSHGEDGAEYRTRRNPFEKIVQHGYTYLPGSYFEVFGKDGRISTFGEAGARLFRTKSGIEQVYQWSVSTTRDRYNNEIEYLYDAPVFPGETDPHALYLQEIAYGGTGTEDSRRRVRLEYSVRPDVKVGYSRGVEHFRNQRVSNIVTEGPQGQLLGTYRLEYDQDVVSGLTRLTSVAQCDAGSPEVCLPPTTFDWLEPESGIPYGFVPHHEFDAVNPDPDNPVPLVASPNRHVGDFDGDGDHDVIFWTPDGWRAWDGYSTNLLDDNAITLSWPVSLPLGNQVVIDDIDHDYALEGEAAIGRHLDKLQPGFGYRIFNANGDARCDVLMPQRNLVVGEPPSIDEWGYRFADRLVVATASTPWGAEPDAGFSEPVHFVESEFVEPGDPIYTVVTLDHNSDGLGDVWLCRGPGYKSGTWVLGINGPVAGAAPGTFGFTMQDTGIGCSVHDELLVTSLDGVGQDLLVVPAFETGPDMPVPDDFVTADQYRDLYEPTPEAERTEYLALSFDSSGGQAELVASGLPRDHYQRWHDRECRNGLANHFFERPLGSAGLGTDKLADVNGDGLVDVVRFELASGDTMANPDIMLGLDPTDPGGGSLSWDSGNLCGDEVEGDLLALMRPYINTGSGFVAGDPIHTFSGNAHANLWLNFRRAQLFDFNLDGLTDFLLPSGGEGGDWTIVTSVGAGNYVDSPIDLPEGWPSYDDGATWEADMDASRTGSMVALRPLVDEPPIITFLGHVSNPPPQWGGIINALTTTYNGPHHRVHQVTDGLGSVVQFDYERISMTGSAATSGPLDYPRGGGGASRVVVKQQHVQANPQGDFFTTSYEYGTPVVDKWGRGFVGFETIDSTLPEGARERLVYDLSRDEALGDYPGAGTPVTKYSQESYVTPSGVEYWVTRTSVTNEVVQSAEYGGTTFFSYPKSTVVDTYVLSEPCVGSCELPAADLFRSSTLEEARDGLGTVVWSRETSVNETTTTTIDSVYNDEEQWIVGRPLSTSTTSCISGQCKERSVEQTIDPATGRPDWSVVQPDDPALRLETTYAYDGHGNPTSVVATAADGESRESVTTWNAEGTFPESSVNAVGHESWAVHDELSGALVAAVAADGVTVVNTYDGFYRKTQSQRRIAPLGPTDGFQVTTSFESGAALYDDNSVADSAMRVRVTDATGREETTDLGPTGRVLQSSWRGMLALQEPPLTTPQAGEVVYVSSLYDSLGRPERSSLATWAGDQPAGYQETIYDAMGRESAVVAANGTTATVEHDHFGTWRSTARTDGAGNTTTSWVDSRGRIREVVDAQGTRTCFGYGPFGLLETVTRDCDDPDSPWVDRRMHDDLGRLIESEVFGAGVEVFSYSAFGNLLSKTDGDGNVTTYDSDALGRVVSRNDLDGETVFTFDSERLGYLSEAESADGVVTSYTYDPSGRVASKTLEDLLLEGPATLTVSYEYGAGDQISRIQYPSSHGAPAVGVRYHYDEAGYLRWIDRDSGDRIWSSLEANAESSLTREAFGNGLVTRRGYEPLSGFPVLAQTAGDSTVVQSLGYEWHPWGALESRHDGALKQQEDFVHDALHRLTSASVHDGDDLQTTNVAYDAFGNITSKSDVGGYVYEDGLLTAYGGTVPAIVEYDGRGNVIGQGSVSLTYTSFDKVRQIVDGAEVLDFRYTADGSRYLRRSQFDDDEVVNVGSLFEYRRHLGSIDLTHRVSAGGRVVAQIRQERMVGGWDESVEYLHDDHLGSTNVVTDEAGDVLRRVSYDPWGRARDGADWTSPADSELVAQLGVGFTGHRSQLDAGLVDMGGRMYNPEIARFLSADPIVAGAYNGQAYNRYSYVHNRPLVGTDPTGYEPSFEREFNACRRADDCDLDKPGFRIIIVGAEPTAADEMARLNSMGGGPGLYSQFNPHAASNPLRHPLGNGYDSRFLVSKEMCELMAGCMPSTRPKPCVTVLCATELTRGLDAAAQRALEWSVVGDVMRQAGDALAAGEGLGEVAAVVAQEAVLGIIPGGKKGKKLVKVLGKADKAASTAKATAKTGGKKTLFHYTDDAGLEGIKRSQQLRASTKARSPKDARYGDGQYMSDIVPGTKTCAQLSRCFIGQPFQGDKFKNFIEIDVSGLDVVKGRDGVFVVPNSGPLDPMPVT